MAFIGISYKPMQKFAFRGITGKQSVCDFCGAKGTTIFQKFKGVFEIAGIPLFPVRGTVETNCENCGRSSEENRLGFINHDLAQEIIAKKSFVIGDFAGLLVFPFLLTIVYTIYSISQTATFMVDNASNRAIIVSHKSSSPFTSKLEVDTVAAEKHEFFSIPYDANAEVTIEGKTYNFNIVKGKKYVFNVDTIYNYVESEVHYQVKSIFSVNDNNDDAGIVPKVQFLPKQLFFDTEVDYLIKAPNELTKEEMKGKDKILTKKVLYHFDSKTDSLSLNE